MGNDTLSDASLQQVFRKTAKLHHSLVRSKLSNMEMYPGQPPLMLILAKQDGMTQKDLAREMQIAPATLNVMVGRMERNKILKRCPDENDQRLSRVFLTEKGKKIIEDMKAVVDEIEQHCFHNFTPEEKERFRDLLMKLYNNLKQAGDEL